MKIGFAKVDDLLALGILDISVANVPFLGDGPVKHLSSAGHFADGHRNMLPNPAQRFADAVAGNAPAYRIHFGDELVHLAANGSSLGAPREVRDLLVHVPCGIWFIRSNCPDI